MSSLATPRSASDYYRRQQRIAAAVLLAVRMVWRRMDPTANWAEQYEEDGVGAQLALITAAAQVAAARDADAYIASVLVELGLAPDATPGVVIPKAFSGIAGDGRPVVSLFAQAIPRAGQVFNTLRNISPAREPLDRPEWASDAVWHSLERERTARLATDLKRNLDSAATQALADAGRWVEMITHTMVIDAARAAEVSGAAVYPQAQGWVRMLNLPSCSRCVVLAGRFYRWSEGFERHPLCDCRHIPSAESDSGDMRVNASKYFDSLPTAADLAEQHPDLTVRMRREAGLVSQEDVFTNAGAEAIRHGADINQVVNARRGMRTAQIGGRDALLTSEGVTRRGVAYRTLTQGQATDVRGTGERYFSASRPRVMPETLLAAATDRDDAVRLLKLNGFIL